MANTNEIKEVITNRVQHKIQLLMEQQQRKLAFLTGHQYKPIEFTINPNLNFSETLHFLVETAKMFNISLDELVLGESNEPK